jgi:hypothetical protein|tara:strand:+ start:1001 stop:1249 length:249 start_codon:yes stop_codon:yes gene_type:complete
MFEDPFSHLNPDDPSELSIEDALKAGHTHFLTASLIFGEILDPDGEPLVYDLAECFKEINEETIRDFYKRVADELCDLLEEE